MTIEETSLHLMLNNSEVQDWPNEHLKTQKLDLFHILLR